MQLPRYTLRDLFLSMTLIAMGVAGCVWFHQLGGFRDAEMPANLISLASGSLLGAGFFAPFHKKVGGAFIGLLIDMVIFLFAEHGHAIRS